VKEVRNSARHRWLKNKHDNGIDSDAVEDFRSLSMEHLCTLVGSLSNILDEQAGWESKDRKDYYEYIPLDYEMFVKILRQETKRLKRKPELKFLEVGCGYGLKLFLAKYACDIGHVHGIEIEGKLVDLARYLPLPFDAVERKSALQFKKYGDFDIIYFYRPIINKKKHEKMMRMIAKQKKADAVVIFVNDNDLIYRLIQEEDFEKVISGRFDDKKHLAISYTSRKDQW